MLPYAVAGACTQAPPPEPEELCENATTCWFDCRPKYGNQLLILHVLCLLNLQSQSPTSAMVYDIQQISVTCQTPKYLKLLLKEPNNLPLKLKEDDEQETEEQQPKKQDRA